MKPVGMVLCAATLSWAGVSDAQIAHSFKSCAGAAQQDLVARKALIGAWVAEGHQRNAFDGHGRNRDDDRVDCQNCCIQEGDFKHVLNIVRTNELNQLVGTWETSYSNLQWTPNKDFLHNNPDFRYVSCGWHGQNGRNFGDLIIERQIIDDTTFGSNCILPPFSFSFIRNPSSTDGEKTSYDKGNLVSTDLLRMATVLYRKEN